MMFEAVCDGVLGGLLLVAILWICNKIVTMIAKGMSREGVSGYEIHESFQQKQAERLKRKHDLECQRLARKENK